MCLIAFAIGTHPALPLLLAGNRDEFFNRPTEALHRWPETSGIWAGRDGRDHGTWLGMTEAGRVALLTNVRSAMAGPGARSRGELVTRWLQDAPDLDRFVADLNPAAYGGFNLVVGDLHSGCWTWLCNRDPSRPHTDAGQRLHRRELDPGVYGLSNAVLDSPWPKTQRLTAALRQALQADVAEPEPGDSWEALLRATLSDSRRSGLQELPSTGVDTALEQGLSSAFVDLADRGYGTRSSLLMRVTRHAGAGQAELVEWTHPPGHWSTESPTRIRFDW